MLKMIILLLLCFNVFALAPYKAIVGTPLEEAFIALAHKSMSVFLAKNVIIDDTAFCSIDKTHCHYVLQHPWLGKPRGVFITLIKHNRVRGCVGSIYPQYKSLVRAIISTSILALYKDRRYTPVSLDELSDIKVIISIVGDMQSIPNPYNVDLLHYGIAIKKHNRTAALLPGEARTLEWGLRIIMHKSGIADFRGAEIVKFRTVTYDERRLK